MRHETYVGPDVPGLFARARAELGPDAVVVSVKRLGRAGFEVVAQDVASPDAEAPVFGAMLESRRAALPKPGVEESTRRPDSPSGNTTAMMPCLSDPQSRRHHEPAVIALVGPTGAGKTTTIAKLARHPKVFDRLPVGLLCLDTYRIGAVEQLKIYAEIAGLPLEVAYEASDLRRAMKRLRDCEVVLVDTAGRGPAAAADLDETKDRLRELSPIEVHLTLPAGLQPELARRVIARHRPLGLTHLLATKLDEYAEDITVFALAAELALPMRWFTDGQEVPMDLKSAAPGLIAAGRSRSHEGALRA